MYSPYTNAWKAVAGISIRLRILKVVDSADKVKMIRQGCRDIDPVEDTERQQFGAGTVVGDWVAGISIRLRILKDQLYSRLSLIKS